MQHQLPQSPVLSCTTPYKKHLDKLKLLGRFSLNYFWSVLQEAWKVLEECKHFLKETCYSCDVNNLTACHQVWKWHSDCQGNTWVRAMYVLVPGFINHPNMFMRTPNLGNYNIWLTIIIILVDFIDQMQLCLKLTWSIQSLISLWTAHQETTLPSKTRRHLLSYKQGSKTHSGTCSELEYETDR